jgi:hypothetical protein
LPSAATARRCERSAASSEGFIISPPKADDMSQATKVVLGTVLLSAVFSVGIILSYVFA